MLPFDPQLAKQTLLDQATDPLGQVKVRTIQITKQEQLSPNVQRYQVSDYGQAHYLFSFYFDYDLMTRQFLAFYDYHGQPVTGDEEIPDRYSLDYSIKPGQYVREVLGC